MKSIALTGATSMIGIALINVCTSNNIEVYAFIHRDSKNINHIPDHPLIKIIECNLDELKDFDVSCFYLKIDCFYHIGWAYTDKKGRTLCKKQIQNIEFTLDLINLAKKLGCKKIVGVGSQAEYGIASVPLNDSVPCNPITPYGIAKFSAGKIAKIRCKELGIKFNWVRILSVYGKNDNEDSLIKTFIKNCRANVSFPLSPCTHVWDYLYETDAGRALYLIGTKGMSGRVYCLGSGKGIPLKRYLEIIRNKINPDYQPCYGNISYSDFSIPYLVADIAELKKHTGWSPQVSFDDGIRDMLELK